MVPAAALLEMRSAVSAASQTAIHTVHATAAAARVVAKEAHRAGCWAAARAAAAVSVVQTAVHAAAEEAVAPPLRLARPNLLPRSGTRPAPAGTRF